MRALLTMGFVASPFDYREAIAGLAAKKIIEQDKDARIDGYLVYQMNCWNQVVQTLAGSGKPVLLEFQSPY